MTHAVCVWPPFKTLGNINRSMYPNSHLCIIENVFRLRSRHGIPLHKTWKGVSRWINECLLNCTSMHPSLFRFIPFLYMCFLKCIKMFWWIEFLMDGPIRDKLWWFETPGNSPWIFQDINASIFLLHARFCFPYFLWSHRILFMWKVDIRNRPGCKVILLSFEI